MKGRYLMGLCRLASCQWNWLTHQWTYATSWGCAYETSCISKLPKHIHIFANSLLGKTANTKNQVIWTCYIIFLLKKFFFSYKPTLVFFLPCDFYPPCMKKKDRIWCWCFRIARGRDLDLLGMPTQDSEF